MSDGRSHYQRYARILPDGTVGSTTLTRDDLSTLDNRSDGTFYRAMPKGAKSRKKWLWSPALDGWTQRYRGRVSASNPTLTADGVDTVEVQVALVDPAAHLDDVAIEINGEALTVVAGEVLVLGPVDEVGQYQVRLTDPRVFGEPSDTSRTVLVIEEVQA